MDARLTTNLGGRDNAKFIWYIQNINYTVTDETNLVVIPNSNISSLVNTDILIKLTVINWYNQISSSWITVHKSSQEIIPNIRLNGVNKISADTINLLNGQIDIYSIIETFDNCIIGNDTQQNTIYLNEDDYSISWFVKMSPQTINDSIDRNIENKLQIYLKSQSNNPDLSIDSSLLEAGINYEFIMNFECDNTTYHCSLNTSHSIIYDHSNIICKIKGGDITLYTYSINDFETESYTLNLNGKLFTYDPDNYSNSNHLQFSWQCIDNVTNICDELQFDRSASIINVDLSESF